MVPGRKTPNAQILKLSCSRCTSKRENKGPSGVKLRLLGRVSVGRDSDFFMAHLCVSCAFCAAPSPHTSPTSHICLLRKYDPKWDTYGCNLEISLLPPDCIFPAEIIAFGSVKCFPPAFHSGPVLSATKFIEACDCFLASHIGKGPACHI